jgi:uncharacterized membrane protein YhhN
MNPENPMNPFKAAAAVLLVAVVVILLTTIKNIEAVVLGITVLIITSSVFTYAASLRRRSNDRRAAGM